MHDESKMGIWLAVNRGNYPFLWVSLYYLGVWAGDNDEYVFTYQARHGVTRLRLNQLNAI